MANNTDKSDKKPSTPTAAQESAAGSKKAESKPGVINPATKTPPARRTGPLVQPQRMSRRMAARYQSDLKRQRQLIYAAIIIVVLIVLVFAVGIYQSLIGPSIKTLANFDGMSVSSGDYFTYRKILLYKELGQLQNISGGAAGDQAQQVQQQIQSISYELGHVQDAAVDQPTLERLVSDKILEKTAKDQFGITVSDAELNDGLGREFTLYTPTANPEQNQATQTANVVVTASGVEASKTASAQTPLPTPTIAKPTLPADVAAHATDVAVTKAAGGVVSDTPGANTPAATANGTVIPAGTAATANASTTVSTTTVAATPTVAPTATAIPAVQSNATASARQDSTLQSLKDAAGISADDYKKYWSKALILQQKVQSKLVAQLPVPGQPYNQLQIHVAHILVADEQTAKDIKAKLDAASDKDATFIELARQYDATTDQTAAKNNGDLGWAIKGTFVDPFWDAATKLSQGQISDPVHTTFGWHVIRLLDKKDNGPMEVSVYQALTDPAKSTDSSGNPKVYADWLKDAVDKAKATYNTPPTPTPSPSPLPTAVFTPVVPPTATPIVPTQPAVPGLDATAGAIITAGSGTAAAATNASGTTVAVTPSVVASPSATTTAAATTIVATTLAVTPSAAPSPNTPAATATTK
jgi:parvulin-like peptidyl-prolyl isomerase